MVNININFINIKYIMPQSNSQHTYVRNWLQMIKEAGSEDTKKILQHILNKNVKLNTKANLLNAIISVARHQPHLVKNLDDFTIERDKIQKLIKLERDNDNQNEKQRSISDSVKWSDIENVLETLKANKDNSKRDLEDYILLALMIPPLRNDLQEIKICKNKKELTKLNCIFLNGNTAVLRINHHKTTSRGGKPIIKEIDEELTDDIRTLISDGRTHLFVNKNGEPFKQSNFTQKIEKLFEKHLHHKIGVTMLRKLYHTANTAEDMEKLEELQEKIDKKAKQMGHSIGVIKSNYIDNTK